MSAPAANPMTAEPRRFSIRLPRRLTWCWLTVIVTMLVVVGHYYYSWARPHQIHSQAYDRISDAVDTLTNHRPAQVTRNEWSYLIGWTKNAIGNCCSIPEYLNPDRASHDRFLKLPGRFEEKIAGEVGIETIDWLWDELEVISKYGKRYSAQYRPTTRERLAEADHVKIGPDVP